MASATAAIIDAHTNPKSRIFLWEELTAEGAKSVEMNHLGFLGALGARGG